MSRRGAPAFSKDQNKHMTMKLPPISGDLLSRMRLSVLDQAALPVRSACRNPFSFGNRIRPYIAKTSTFQSVKLQLAFQSPHKLNFNCNLNHVYTSQPGMYRPQYHFAAQNMAEQTMLMDRKLQIKMRRKKNFKKGIQFCLMVCGASGTGKM